MVTARRKPASAAGLWIRWSWRDLRSRWVSVATIALVIAIGTGVYAGLTSTSAWRRESNDASFAALRMYDLRVRLGPSSFVSQGRLVAIAESVDARVVDGADERLVLPTQVDASTSDRSILVPGRIVGTAVGVDMVNDIDVTKGRGLAPSDSGRPVTLIEHHFADFYDLDAVQSITLPGGQTVETVGWALTPEYFIVTGERGGFLAESNYAVVFTSLDTAQRLTGHPGSVNDLVVTLRPGTDRDAFEDRLRAALTRDLPDAAATVSTRDEERAYQVLYDDISSDEKFWTVLSMLVLGAAFVAAFNLISRMVEAQRREIGVGMALGMNPGQLAIRPMLVGLQVSLLGVLLGVGVGVAVGAAMRSLLVDVLPLPIWRTPFQLGAFLRAALIGALIPLIASVFPVARAVRVDPIDAIKPSHLVVRGKGVPALFRRVAIPGRTMTRLPVRDLVRNPRRTILTVVGIGAAISALVGVSGLLDTFFHVIDRGEAEIEGDVEDRVNVALDTFVPVGGDLVGELRALPEVGAVQAVVSVPAALVRGTTMLDTETTMVDLAGPIWHPTVDVRPTTLSDPPGIYLASKAMEDLGVSVGDEVTLRHPVRTTSGFALVDDVVTVAGVHPNPLRFLAYMDQSESGLFGLDGLTNSLYVRPATGFGTSDLERAIFGRSGVTSVQAARTAIDEFDSLLDQFVGFLRITQAAVLVLALMIAFNTSRITVDERARQHATMFAFGVPVRVVWLTITVESLLVGVLGALLGIGGGALMTTWMIEWLLPDTAPDIGLEFHLSGGTIGTALAVGIVAVGLAPLLTVRRLARMNLPSTLRLVE